MGNFLEAIQISTGDFGVVGDNAPEEFTINKVIFWITWSFIVLLMTIIFLNFIIAEASASYERISDLIDESILQDKAGLIQVAENMYP